MYFKLSYMVHGHRSIYFINKFNKTSYASQTSGQTTIKSLFLRNRDNKGSKTL